MPVRRLENLKHEVFAQQVAKGLTPELAYEMAGFKPHRQSAHRLLTNADVQKRVRQLLRRGTEKAEVTVERVVQEFADCAFGAARLAPTWSDKISALSFLGKHMGMFKEGVNLNVTLSLAELVLQSYKQIEGKAEPEK